MQRDGILGILARHQEDLKTRGVKKIALFGSAARNEARPDSDLDILVEFDIPVGLFEFVELKDYLEELLGRNVDMVTPGALKPQLREQILREAIYAV